MREIIANAVKDNPVEFSEAVLGKPNEDYCKWIRNPNSWGGAIEVSILSNYYGMEIVVIDTQSGLISRFGEDKNYPHRVFFIYDGIHYDPLYLEAPFVSIVKILFLIVFYLFVIVIIIFLLNVYNSRIMRYKHVFP